jgi:phage terminase large subunit-like protein
MAMVPDAVLAPAKQNDADTGEALTAAQDSLKAHVVLKGCGSLGTSPAGQSTNAVTAKTSGVIDEVIAEVNQAITVLTRPSATPTDPATAPGSDPDTAGASS